MASPLPRKYEARRTSPILLVSARRDEILIRFVGLGLGADDYMTKPSPASELVARVKAHLARYTDFGDSGKEENEIIEIRGLRLIPLPEEYFVKRRRGALYLQRVWTFWPFLRLIKPGIHQGRAVSGNLRMESIGDIATVTVHIKKLHEKIEMEECSETPIH